MTRGAPAQKRHRAGTHRVAPPEETVARVRPLAPAMGITRVANVTGLDILGIPVTMVCRPNARSLAVSQGKGLTLAAAQASGLMEAIELHHAESIQLPLKLASAEDLRYTHELVDNDALPQIRATRFGPHLPILWIEGWDLLAQRAAWLPYETVSMDLTIPRPAGSGCFVASSNGLASGNHHLEAISHGICEVVERDALALWHARSEAARARLALDLQTVDDADCRSVLDRLHARGMHIAAWEITSDIAIPVFTCLLVDSREEGTPRASGGHGCHPSRGIALLRALLEAVQSRLTVIAGSRDDLDRRQYDAREANRTAGRLLAPGAVAVRRFHDAPTHDAETIDDDVAWELEQLHGAGLSSIVVVDLTKTEFKLPVVRVVAPGLEGYIGSPDYQPGARARRVVSS